MTLIVNEHPYRENNNLLKKLVHVKIWLELNYFFVGD